MCISSAFVDLGFIIPNTNSIFNNKMHYFGKLCLRKHEHVDGKSIRYRANSTCVACAKIHSAETEKTEHTKAVRKIYRATDKYIKLHSKCMEVYSRSTRGKETQLKHKNTPKYKETLKRYLNSDNGKLNVKRAKYRRRIQIKENSVPYTVENLQKLVNIFGNVCVYCGGQWDSIDHVVPLSKGGKDALHNLVPACRKCNSSKNAKDISEWYITQSFYNHKKHKQILCMCDILYTESMGYPTRI